ncbi:unnamed protein product, partial [Closterium sp. NIES-54]
MPTVSTAPPSSRLGGKGHLRVHACIRACIRACSSAPCVYPPGAGGGDEAAVNKEANGAGGSEGGRGVGDGQVVPALEAQLVWQPHHRLPRCCSPHLVVCVTS